MHDGHRERMRKKFLAGVRFADHEMLEMLLTFSIPRKNTNEIAHRLLTAFGSVDGVLSADYEQLLMVRGIGPQSAFQIKLVGALRGVERSEDEGGLYLDTVDKLGAYAVELFAGIRSGTISPT